MPSIDLALPGTNTDWKTMGVSRGDFYFFCMPSALMGFVFTTSMLQESEISRWLTWQVGSIHGRIPTVGRLQ
jgi:hypothetical protein